MSVMLCCQEWRGAAGWASVPTSERWGGVCLLAPRQLCPVWPQSLGSPKGSQGGDETGDPVMFPSQPGGLLGKFCRRLMLMTSPRFTRSVSCRGLLGLLGQPRGVVGCPLAPLPGSAQVQLSSCQVEACGLR